jgi:hypothetical protein
LRKSAKHLHFRENHLLLPIFAKKLGENHSNFLQQAQQIFPSRRTHLLLSDTYFFLKKIQENKYFREQCHENIYFRENFINFVKPNIFAN